MPKIIPGISPKIEEIKKKTKIFGDIWSRRIDYAIAQLVSARLFYGKAREGEMGLSIVKFVKETWRSISITRRLDKLSKSNLGKAYVAKLILRQHTQRETRSNPIRASQAQECRRDRLFRKHQKHTGEELKQRGVHKTKQSVRQKTSTHNIFKRRINNI